MKRINTKGFTVIELLVATVSFSLILLILTAAIIQFNRLYYKGVVDTKTQEVTRAIVDDISRNIQFSAGSTVTLPDHVPPNPPTNDRYICAGGYVYKYIRRQLVETGPALIRYKSDTCTPLASPPASSQPTELLGKNMFLQNLTLTSPTTNVYTLTVQVGYGKPYATGAPDEDHNSSGTCRFTLRLGGQFCAFHDLSVTVIKRL